MSNFAIDTNVLISALLSPHSTNALALKKARELGKVVYSAESGMELSNVLMRKKFDPYFSIEARLEILDRFLSDSFEIIPKEKISVCRDPKDNMFLELAYAASSSCLITGDPDLLVLNPFRNIPIINASDFIRRF
ncbi:MAG: putative toxin-antitoxin system toxin component, PIN family [Candidatus Cyclobacteriaceae bacterium M3_2C_046]